MRYRFARAFIVEGLLATEGQEIVLSDQPDKGRKFMLTGSADSLLTDADKSAAAGLIAISRITVAGAPPPPLPRSKPLEKRYFTKVKMWMIHFCRSRRRKILYELSLRRSNRGGAKP